jgi:hypothetical protein
METCGSSFPLKSDKDHFLPVEYNIIVCKKMGWVIFSQRKVYKVAKKWTDCLHIFRFLFSIEVGSVHDF